MTTSKGQTWQENLPQLSKLLSLDVALLDISNVSQEVKKHLSASHLIPSLVILFSILRAIK